MSVDQDESFMDRLSANKTEDTATSFEKELRDITASKEKLMVEQSQAFLEDLFSDNSTLPVKVRNVQVTNSQSFRDSFLEKQVNPLLRKDITTLSHFLQSTDEAYNRLVKLGVIENCQISLHQIPKQMWDRGSESTLHLVPVFNIVPQKRFFAKTGTNIGNGEGDGYIQFQFKNLFGGAENVMVDAVTGTKTPSSYIFNYSQPLFNDARYIWDSSIFVNTRKLEWIQSSVDQKGFSNKISSRLDNNINFEASFENTWRQLSNHGSKSMRVLTQSKDTIKSSVFFNIVYDTRNHRITPTAGKYARLGLERSGLFSFNNVSFIKIMCESQVAQEINKNHSLIFTSKAGGLFSLQEKPTNVLDRFFIGGPNDVRSFSLNGLGPKDRTSSIGGDFFLNGGLSLISRIPRTSHESNFKLHNFLNFGKLFDCDGSLPQIMKGLKNEYSIGIGSGILYNHPMARFELNLVLPITSHPTDYLRKGVQYGVGISFL